MNISNKELCINFGRTIVEEFEFVDAYEAIEDTHLSAEFDEPSGAFILGEPGTGKTAVLNAYLKDNPPQSLEDREHVPVVFINATSTPSIHNFAKKLIGALDNTNSIPKNLEDKQRRLLVLKEQLGLQLVIVDEFHDMQTNARSPADTAVVNFVKYLLSQLKVAVIVAGLPCSEEVLKVDHQIATRCSDTVHLTPFSAHDKNAANRFQMYMDGILELYPHKFEDVKPDELLLRVLLATAGNKRSINRLLQYAALKTRQGTATTLEILDLSWNKKINENIRISPHIKPFEAKIKKVEAALKKEGFL